MHHHPDLYWRKYFWYLLRRLSPIIFISGIFVSPVSAYNSIPVFKPENQLSRFQGSLGDLIHQETVRPLPALDIVFENNLSFSKKSDVLDTKDLNLSVANSDFLSERSFNVVQILNSKVPIPPLPKEERQTPPVPSRVPEQPTWESSPDKTQPSSPSPTTTPDSRLESFPENIVVTKFKFVDNTTFKEEKLAFKKKELADNIQVFISEESPGEVQVCPSEETTNNNQDKSIELIKSKCTETLSHIIQDLDNPSIELSNKRKYRFSLPELLKIANEVAVYYKRKHYTTSGAVIYISEDTRSKKEGEVEIRVIEGELKEENIKVIFFSEQPDNSNSITVSSADSRHRLNTSYIKSRLALAASKPLNLDKLQEALQLLQLDPLIKSVTARLSAGATPGESILDVQIQEAKSLNTALSFDNSRVPSVGSSQPRVSLTEGNFLGIGDRLSIGYAKTVGSNSWDASYTLPFNLPFNPNNGTLRLAYSSSNNQVIEAPFDDIDKDGNSGDIKSASRSYELTLRQPIIRSIRSSSTKESTRQSTFQEFTLGLTGSWRESETSLLDIPFPFSLEADDNGSTRIFALRFFQDWTQQNAQEVISLRSQFNFGFNAFGSSLYKPLPGVNEIVADSRFFSWQGQALWLRVLNKDTFLRLRANVQLADRALVSSEQFASGGFGSVRGYRQDTLQTDNGVFATAEVELPVLHIFKDTGVIQVIPFGDYSIGWNSSGQENPISNSLASLGLGLQWRQGNNFNARLDWGIPLVSAESRGRTWQEQGIYFTIQWNPF